MIESGTLLLYTIGAALLIISPGPDFIYVTTRGIAQGKQAGILSALGISIGLIVHTILAALGLSALLQASKVFFEIIKYTGAAYLIYIGMKSFLNNENMARNDEIRKLNKKAIFRQGVLTNVFNPKAIITFMAFIPQFINTSDGTAPMQIAIMGAIIAALAIIWFGIVGYFAGTIGTWLSKRSSIQKFIRWTTGSILVSLGLRLALTKNSK